jgi:hypothetical protein
MNYCNFCGKSQNEVKLIAGPTAFICYECVDLCYDIKTQKKEPKSEPEKYRLSYRILVAYDMHQDFDTMKEAIDFDEKRRDQEESFIFRHRSLPPTFSKVIERVIS